MEIMKLKQKMNAKRPEFKHYDYQKRKEVDSRWRRPRGLHNKMRKGVWGRPASVNVGYRTPAQLRGMQLSLFPVMVSNSADLAKINTKTQGALIAHVGNRTRKVLLLECEQKKIKVLNFKSAEELRRIDNAAFLRKERKKKIENRKAKAKPAEVKEEKKETLTKEQENKEMQKLVTQRS